MKCMLITPPTTRMIGGWSTGELKRSEPLKVGFFSPPSLGILYLAACAETLQDIEVRVLGAQDATHDQVREKIAAYQPDVVGIGTMVFTLIDALDVAHTVRRVAPQAKIVFGGIHPTLYPKETINFPDVDYVVRGEGEYAFKRLLEALARGDAIEAIPGVVSKQTLDPESVKPQIIENLDELPPPAWHLVENLPDYMADKQYISAFTSRGCVGKCTFCNLQPYVRRFRGHSANYVFNHIKAMVNSYGIKGVFFWDDCFTIDKKRVLELCRLLIESGLHVQWKCFSRIDTVDETMLHAMVNAGCGSVDFGIESGDPRIQALTRKNLDLGKVQRVISMAYDCGLKTNAFVMLGHPTESVKEIKNTIKFVLSLPLHFINFNIFVPLPFTDSYLAGLRSGIIKTDYFKAFAEKPDPDFKLKFWNEIFTDDELRYWQKKMMHSFYCRWIYVWRGFVLVYKRKQLFSGIKWYIQKTLNGF